MSEFVDLTDKGSNEICRSIWEGVLELHRLLLESPDLIEEPHDTWESFADLLHRPPGEELDFGPSEDMDRTQLDLAGCHQESICSTLDSTAEASRAEAQGKSRF